jgi:hypothetical protein
MKPILCLFAATLAYALVRYLAFMPENLGNLPIFVINKGLAMAAALAFVVAFHHQWRDRGDSARAAPWFRAGMFGSIAHVPMSLAILTPAYFREFFAGDRLSFNGESVFLFGALTAGCLYLSTRPQWTPLQRWALSLATTLALFCHVLFMGVARGLNIGAKHAYLPPMWLLSAIGLAFGLAFLLLARPGAGRTP